MWGGVQVTSPACALYSMEEAEQVTSGQELLDITATFPGHAAARVQQPGPGPTLGSRATEKRVWIVLACIESGPVLEPGSRFPPCCSSRKVFLLLA